MNRLSPGYPGFSSDGSSGGDADLQTDVMRFMAILALCLVAIFALVQAIPVEAQREPVEPVAVVAAPPLLIEAAEDAQPAVVSPAPLAEPAKAPTGVKPAKEQEPTVVEPARQAPAEAAANRAAAPAPADAGFTLRFESDAVLRSLVAENQVDLYAMRDARAWSVDLVGGKSQLKQAAHPRTFHEMEAATVPLDIVMATESLAGPGSAVSWGVTLPPELARRIDRRVAAGGSGDLVITASGGLRQE